MSMDAIKAEIKETISESVDDSFNVPFSSMGSLRQAPETLELSLKDHGRVNLPLSQHDADLIISNARQSPFGKGSETIVDTTVRKCWQLDPSQFDLNSQNPSWETSLSAMVDHIHQHMELTCQRENVSAELYKLLLYEEGAFFKPHKDS
jgi:hypothetical protein